MVGKQGSLKSVISHYRGMCDVYKEACFSQKNVYRWAKLFKDIQNSIQDEDRSGRPTMVSSPEIVDSVNVLILSDNRGHI